ncbi:hypothetical protein BJV82DRAFT_566857 [Fennellomyces sp. T-0311]|nr:hypothetical protein BJV82DRAFT_566857 [Fennellomyces sp. T-0311]
MYKPVTISSSAMIKLLAMHLRNGLLDAKEFGKWCSRKKVDFIKTRAVLHNTGVDGKQKELQRLLYMLKQEYHEQVVTAIKNNLIHFQEELQGLKNSGVEFLGYVRKSPGCNDDTRIRLLQQMVQQLYKRSRVNKVYVSPICKSNDRLSTRDLPRPTRLLKKTDRHPWLMSR